MAQYRQTGTERLATSRGGGVGHDHHGSSGAGADQIGIRINHNNHHHHHYKRGGGRRSKNQQRKFSIGFVVVILLVAVIVVSIFAFNYLSKHEDIQRNPNNQDDQAKHATGFISDLNQTNSSKVLRFGKGSSAHGRDSVSWDADDRRRDREYDGDALDHNSGSVNNHHISRDDGNGGKKDPLKGSHHYTGLNHQSGGLYNEAGRNELRHYEAEYETSLRNTEQFSQDSFDTRRQNNEINSDDEYDDHIDSHSEGFDDSEHEGSDLSDVVETVGENHGGVFADNTDNAMQLSNSRRNTGSVSASEKGSSGVNNGRSAKVSTSEKQSGVRRRGKGHRFSSCEMKFLNSTAHLVEPVENHRFTRFSLQYTEVEDKPTGVEDWVPRFAGHQSQKDREESYYARDQRINCGFIKGPKGSPSTGFDLAEDDIRFMSSCHIVITRSSRKNVCFVMFMDEDTLRTLESEGQKLDRVGFIGLWKIVVVKNLPYSDMRRVGKIPKLLTHRLFPSARYSIWLDSKLRLQRDPSLILEYFLWRQGHEYAISNHYDRHCVWEEVAQNKRLNKYNHTVIDEQFAFYQADGLKRFNASDPQRLLPSNVPEGSFIIRAHTPMSNLFSCLWFNEVDHFTPRDQLSFAYTYSKLRRMNPGKNFHLNMFKDCERRTIAKLYHHKAENH
ncbi:hypothetical protein QJS10_CPB13g00672 [Acorus calamus]|uniref:TOD1/MUCI70 glycosyltransferase-like domain-containing protein n=1 Tax=Acorus calamus TaxID=4465 RepID=A0AAV9DIX5_ACOCL|nr:hypothetical protein QJS10_CPB13g00672 [Acorus calamus]